MALRHVPTIVCGEYHTLCLSNDGNVYSFGESTERCHGQEEEKVFPPKMISTLKNITSIARGRYHTACLDSNGNVYSFGRHSFGNASGKLKYSHVPQRINVPPCIQISCGEDFTMCLTSDGRVYSFGYNGYGQLGLGNTETSNSPQIIKCLQDVEFIDCGPFNVFCKTKTNQFYSWGHNDYGQLGLGNTDMQNSPIQCLSLSNEDVIDIKCGDFHTLVLTSNGDVLSCGCSYQGEIGRETPSIFSADFLKIEDLSDIIRIECGNFFSMCIDIHNDFYVFGLNDHGQLGLDDTDTRYEVVKHPSLSNIIDISRGGNHTFVKTANNEIYAFGNNLYSQLGIKTEDDDQLTPIRVFEDNEDIWCSNIGKSNAKSARA